MESGIAVLLLLAVGSLWSFTTSIFISHVIHDLAIARMHFFFHPTLTVFEGKVYVKNSEKVVKTVCKCKYLHTSFYIPIFR